MPAYLPLCAFRQGLLPATCRSCAWWQTSGNGRLHPEAAADKRRQWMTAVEDTWGFWGLLLEAGGTSTGASVPPAGHHAPRVVGSISFAPAGTMPRLRGLPFDSFTADSALLFCLWLREDQPRTQAKRLLQKALGQLKSRGMSEAFALAGEIGTDFGAGDPTAGHCGLFSAGFLAGNGFEPVMESGGLTLMRADLRGLLVLLSQVETAVMRVLRREPTPSPAAWTRRSTS